jgi:hypothetical protein
MSNTNIVGEKTLKTTLGVIALALVAGCSGGAKTAPTTDTSKTPADLLINVTTVKPAGLQDIATETATVKVTALDTNRNVLSGATVSIVPDTTAVVTVSGTVTDTTGTVTGNIGVGSDSSNRNISVVIKSGTITKTISIPVIGAKLTPTLTPAVVTPGAAGTISYQLVDANNAPISNVAVALSGSFTATGTTDQNGTYVYSYTAPASEQVLTVNAAAAGTTATSTITDSAGTIPPATGVVASGSLDANPTTIGTNQVGSTTNQVQLRASFFDKNNAPVTNIRVRFDLAGDIASIGGTLSSGDNYVYSDANGVARTSYIPAQRPSGNGQLTLRACWSNADFPVVSPAGSACPNNQQFTVPITVVSEGVSITVNTDNIIYPVAGIVPIEYQLAYSVQVVDSAGNPKSGVPVAYSVVIPTYRKGYYSNASGAWQLATWQDCGNEDINANTRLDAFEDYNGDGVMEPSGTAAIVPQATGKDVTDEFGRAYFFLQYGANYATWADYTLNFSASVAGTAGHYTYSGTLLPAADAANDPNVAPPFMASPFGTDTTGARATITDPVSGKSALLCYLGPKNVHGPQ